MIFTCSIILSFQPKPSQQTNKGVPFCYTKINFLLEKWPSLGGLSKKGTFLNSEAELGFFITLYLVNREFLLPFLRPIIGDQWKRLALPYVLGYHFWVGFYYLYLFWKGHILYATKTAANVLRYVGPLKRLFMYICMLILVPCCIP